MPGTLTTQDSGPAPDRIARRTTWPVRALVLGGLAVAAVFTASALALGAGAEYLGTLWTAAIAWTLAASLAGALWRGLRHPDWSAFSACELPEDESDAAEIISRTGRYSSLGEMEEQMLHDDDRLR